MLLGRSTDPISCIRGMGNCGPGLRAMQLHCLLDTRTRCWGSELLQGRRLGTANRKVHRQGFDDLSQKSPRLFQMEHRAPIPLHSARQWCARYLLAPLGPCLTVPWLTNSCCPHSPWLPWRTNPGPWPSALRLLLSHRFTLSLQGPEVRGICPAAWTEHFWSSRHWLSWLNGGSVTQSWAPRLAPMAALFQPRTTLYGTNCARVGE